MKKRMMKRDKYFKSVLLFVLVCPSTTPEHLSDPFSQMILVLVHQPLLSDALAALYKFPTVICAAVRIPLSVRVSEGMKNLGQ